jgi:hypothetical protein
VNVFFPLLTGVSFAVLAAPLVGVPLAVAIGAGLAAGQWQVLEAVDAAADPDDE